ncbi:MAG: hypothetical protein JNK29_17575 [Anaerolineales bacterium]|nr:hypothetical protein [Anaerolineales bacterium]
MPGLVRDLMTIGVPVCHDTETGAVVAARLTRQTPAAEVVVVLDEDGMACGWARAVDLAAQPDQPVSAVMDEAIPQVPPDIPAQAAAQLLRDRGVAYAFLMHDWPGEPRPSAMIALKTLEAYLEHA